MSLASQRPFSQREKGPDARRRFRCYLSPAGRDGCVSARQQVTTNSTFAEIGKVLREHQKFAVLSHVRPDGDALGSELALGLSLKQLGKDVRIWNEEGMLEKYSFVAKSDLVTKPPAEPEDVDVAIALDTAIQNRMGTALASVKSAKVWINIDHHPSNPRYGDLVYI